MARGKGSLWICFVEGGRVWQVLPSVATIHFSEPFFRY
jgi:hypothetical protein